MRKNAKKLEPKASWLGGVKSAAIVLLLMLLSTTTTAWAVSGDTGKLSWSISKKGTLSIRGKYTMPDYRDYDEEPGSSRQAPWYKYKDKISQIEVVGGVTSIGDYAFYGLENVQKITIEKSVTSIGQRAFMNVGSKVPTGCTLKFSLNSKLTTIYPSAFNNFNGDVNLRNCLGLQNIYSATFSGYGAHTITLPASVTGIARNGFYGVDENVKIMYHMYGNRVLYINSSYCAFTSKTTDVDITKYMYISGKYAQANFTIVSLDGKSMTFDETNKCFIISDEQGLLDLGNLSESNQYFRRFYGMTFKLTADLDFSNRPLDNYNSNFSPIMHFGGHFDGQGHTIKGLTYLGSDSQVTIGFFSYVESGGTIENVVLINPKMRGGRAIGGIAGEATLNSTIRNCAVINPTISGYEEVGVIVGDSYKTTVSNCIYDANTKWLICGGGYIDGGGNKAVYHLNLDYGITSDALTFGDFTVSPEGANVKLALNRPGYDFVGFKSNEVSIKNGQFTMPAKNVSVTANWEAQDEINLKASQVDGIYWTTFYCGDAGYYILEDEEAFAYTATVHDDEIILHSLGKYIPMGSAVIIAGEDNSISMKRNDYGYPDFSVDNDLKGVDVPTARTTLTDNGSYELYMLSNKNNHFGFHNFAATNVPARKAFFIVPTSAKAREFTMVFDEETTAIRELQMTNAESPVYDLNGRVVRGNNLKSGIYVKNGKKIVVK